MNLEPLPPEFWTECLPCRTGYYELCTEEHKPSEKDGFFMPKNNTKENNQHG